MALLRTLLNNSTALKQQGFWNASTNTPSLANGNGTVGYYYVVSVGGTVDFGAGNITFTVGDWVYYNTANEWVKFETGVSYTPEDVANKATTFGTVNDILYPSVKAVNDQLILKVNKAGDTMTGNLSAPKVAIGTTDYPAIDTIGEGLTSGVSLDGISQTTRTSRSRIGNAELNFVVNHLHSASNWIKTLFCRSNGNTTTHASVTNGQVIAGNYYAGRYQSGGSGSYYLAAQEEYGIDDSGTISASSMPGKIVRSITPDGSKTPVVYETVKNNGNVLWNSNRIAKSVEVLLTGTYTITEGLGQVFGLNPNGANRDVLLPPNPVVGLQIQIFNLGSLGNSLIVKNSAGVAVSGGTIANNVSLTFTYFSTGWRI